MSKPALPAVICPAVICLIVLLAACDRQVSQGATVPLTRTRGDTSLPERDPRGGAISVAAQPAPAAASQAKPADQRPETSWQPMELTTGKAWVSCEHDYLANGDGQPLASLGYSVMRKALKPCRDGGLLRLRYQGKISDEFVALVERAAELADTLGIDKRILDLDSSGGQIEQAILAGDIIGESGWTTWVREDSICHSSCVLVLAAGDMRMIAGPVGVHRMIRIGSQATSRAELQQELEAVHAQVREYLQRNGVAFAVADLMMTVPNRSLRLLSEDELDLYGLSGRNAVEDDLQRIVLARKCGEAFVERKDAFYRAFDRECQPPGEPVEVMADCGRELGERFGFPDPQCPAESPMSEFEVSVRLPVSTAERDQDA